MKDIASFNIKPHSLKREDTICWYTNIQVITIYFLFSANTGSFKHVKLFLDLKQIVSLFKHINKIPQS